MSIPGSHEGFLQPHSQDTIERIGTLMNPVDVTEQGAMFQLMDRQGFTTSVARRYRAEAEQLAGQFNADETILTGRPQPFMPEEEMAGVVLAAETTPTPLDPVRTALFDLSERREVFDETAAGFLSWTVTPFGEERSAFDTYSAARALTDHQAGDPFDRHRVMQIIASNLVQSGEPDALQTAFSYVAGAAIETTRLEDVRERAVADLLLTQALEFGHGVFVNQTMGVLGRGDQLTMNIQGPVFE